MPVYRFGERVPSVHDSVFVAPNACVIGSVVLSENVSVWFGATIRGDNDTITLGKNTNVQEGAVVHTDPGLKVTIGDNVTIGHQAMVHGCTIGDGSLIGIQAVVLNGAVIGKECLVGAGAVITERKVFPDRSLILGSPARVVRVLSDEDVAKMGIGTASYVERRERFLNDLEEI
ncbi:gamma carbonic anhydrase family protein [Steroidobacter sp.]|uniref:gamma carbonic anhydrase family protein n=1 Tax=Steroidobacter sp. TaxID=1978227 RepID=UPI001A3CC105|nr:gamma carbonic anhydrase family protein [Steroidobacter sp.]MBL8271238.1 gamma carbonic anhydrase family protein [Steroidobacter sp.]